MSKPYLHAKSSARRYGGSPEDYLDIHSEMDCSKAAIADVRHRAIYHSAFGIFIIEKLFGTTRVNSEGKVYSVRDIAEDHVREDLGFIPSMETWLRGMRIEDWMMGKRTVGEKKHIPMTTEPEKPEEDTGVKINPVEDVTVDGAFGPYGRLKFPNKPPNLTNEITFDGKFGGSTFGRDLTFD